MRLKSRLATLVSVGALTVGFAGFGVVMTSGPALADPTCQEVAVGSDTTQDIMNQYSVDLGTNELCSFNAVDPVTSSSTTNIEYIKGANATQPALSCLSQRPNGSGSGQIALRESINSGTTAAPALSPVMPVGCADVGRSSSGPTSNTAGALLFIPYAEDAVAGAIGPAVGGVVNGIDGPITTVATALTTTNMFTTTDLVNLYKNCLTVTEGGVTYWPFTVGGTQPAGTQRIDLYLPQSGSGTFKFWTTTLGIPTSPSLPACDFQTIQQGTSTGLLVEEHTGIAMGTDTDGYGPFSIAQWISQKNHTIGNPVNIDRRYGAVLQSINSISPFSGTLMNTAFPINREIFNVVEACRVDSTAPLPFTGATCSIDPTLQAMLDGAGSSLCQDALSILNYGFALLNAANTIEPDKCGSIATSLRSVPPPV